MERQFFSGNTLEQAVLAAARHYGLDPDRVAYKLRDKKHGFLNIRRNVVIEVDPAAPEQTDEMRAERQVFEAEVAATQERSSKGEGPGPSFEGRHRGDRSHDQDRRPHEGMRDQRSWSGEETSWSGSGQADQDVEAVEKAIEHLGDLTGMKLTSSIQREGRGFEVELSGPESGLLRENQGSGLDAIEHLLPRLVRGLNGHGVPCRVDSGGLRAAREAELQRLARETAEDVSSERVEKRLEPMNPADRRQIHMALVDDPAVRTESEGEGFLKRVRILPA